LFGKALHGQNKNYVLIWSAFLFPPMTNTLHTKTIAVVKGYAAEWCCGFRRADTCGNLGSENSIAFPPTLFKGFKVLIRSRKALSSLQVGG